MNLRDIEGRSALLLGKAKDNNASCALGPFIRLFDAGFGLDQVRSETVHLRVAGIDGFELRGINTHVQHQPRPCRPGGAIAGGAPVSRWLPCCSSAPCLHPLKTATSPAAASPSQAGRCGHHPERMAGRTAQRRDAQRNGSALAVWAACLHQQPGTAWLAAQRGFVNRPKASPSHK